MVAVSLLQVKNDVGASCQLKSIANKKVFILHCKKIPFFHGLHIDYFFFNSTVSWQYRAKFLAKNFEN